MKKFKKIMAVLVAAMMIMATMVPAFADTYNISYNNNGGENSVSQTTSDKPVASSGTMSKADNYFVGWNTRTDGKGTVYLPGDDISGVTEATTLYAQWALSTARPVAEHDSNQSKHKITIKNGVAGQTYRAYKVFDVTLLNSEGNDPNTSGFAYTLDSESSFFATITSGAAQTTVGGMKRYDCTNYGLVLYQAPGATGKYIVKSSMNQAQAQALAAALGARVKTNDPSAVAVDKELTEYNAETKNSMEVNDLGYYLVDSGMGTLCSLDTTNEDVTIYEKNSTPSIIKKVKEDDQVIDVDLNGTADSAANTYGKVASGDVGQSMSFELTVNTGKNKSRTEASNGDGKLDENLGNGVASDYVITDVLPVGMTYNGKTTASPDTVSTENIVVKVAGVTDPWALGTNYTVTYTAGDSTTGDSLVITLLKASLNSAIDNLGEDATITITYGATIDEDIKIGDRNTNTATLSYAGDIDPAFTVADSADVYVEAGAIYKFNTDGAAVSGAKFTMTSPAPGNTAMNFVLIDSGESKANTYLYSQKYANGTEYSVGSNTLTATNELVAPATGAIVIIGLDVGTYTLTETFAPAGYNMLTGTKTMTVKHGVATLGENKTFDTTKPTNPATQATFAKGLAGTYKMNADSIIGIENTTSAELPSTGGMGTTVLYIVGGMLVILAGAYLFFSRKKTA